MKIKQTIAALYTNIMRMDVISNNNAVRSMYQQLYLTDMSCGTTQDCFCIDGKELIVSLTSYGNKLQLLYLTIESLFHQTIKPNRIIVWLDETKYSDINSLPMTLLSQKKRGLEIRLCKDVRSYTKLVPAVENFPDSVIITVDDDILYPVDFVERLVKAYNQDSSKVYFYRGHAVMFRSDGKPAPYIEWVKKGANGSSIYNLPTGVSGVLYPPHCFHEDILNSKLFLDLCPYADDVWFKAMTMLKGVECQHIPTPHFDKLFIPLDIDEENSLQNKNVINGGNDIQIKKVFDYYNITR